MSSAAVFASPSVLWVKRILSRSNLKDASSATLRAPLVGISDRTRKSLGTMRFLTDLIRKTLWRAAVCGRNVAINIKVTIVRQTIKLNPLSLHFSLVWLWLWKEKVLKKKELSVLVVKKGFKRSSSCFSLPNGSQLKKQKEGKQGFETIQSHYFLHWMKSAFVLHLSLNCYSCFGCQSKILHCASGFCFFRRLSYSSEVAWFSPNLTDS